MSHAVAAALALALLEPERWRSGIRASLEVFEGLDAPSRRRIGRLVKAIPLRPEAHELTELIASDPEISLRGVVPRRWATPPLAMAHAAWAVTPLATPADLAALLAVDLGQLAFLADAKGWNTDPRRSHYRSRWVPKRRGGRRLIEAPKARLKDAQRRLLRAVLDRVPPHPAATGFAPGASVHRHGARHAGQRWVLKMDLADFFAHVGSGRVGAIFRALGYPRAVRRLLVGLCTTKPPAALLRGADPVERALHGRRRLPQGAPTSASLANLAAYPLDGRLSALAASIGARYSRYADDLAFSGERIPEWLVPQVAAIGIEEGFPMQLRKTRRMGRSVRQEVTGLVVNVDPAPRREAYDRLRAVLHQAGLDGPAAANREGHTDFRAYLRGRIDWVAGGRDHRRAKLEALFRRIQWADQRDG
jgi:RNA-directed DNA polymerase